MDPLRSNDNIAMGLQEKLWELPHVQQNTTQEGCHSAWNASMIKCNEAQNAVSQNGAEAMVVGWKAHYLTADKLTLDTLFVNSQIHQTLCNWMAFQKMWSSLQANHLNQM